MRAQEADDGARQESGQGSRDDAGSWRRTHGGRGRPIPAALWSDAADVARANGVAKTARALRLDARKLAKLAEARAERAPAFVEIGAIGLSEPREARTTVLELVGREGDRVRVEIAGDAGGVVDLVALARAFWSRGA